MARSLAGHSSGPRRYVRNIISALLAIDHENEYVIYYDSDSSLDKNPLVEEKIVKMPTKMLWDHIGIPMSVKADAIDVLFCPKNIIPPLVKCKTVITILDLGYVAGNYYPFIDSLYMNIGMRYSTRKANAVIAISNSTKSDLVSYFGVKPGKIHAIHLAADESYRLLNDKILLDGIRNKYELPSSFILSVASLHRRKNLPNLIKAFSILKKQMRIEHKLVLIGAPSWKYVEIIREMEVLSAAGDIIWLQSIPEEDLSAVYNLADVLVYPSLYEGFGLPVLEAMACGCPVVCSNTSSLPEVAGNAALLVDPMNVSDIADGVYRVLSDKNLRDDLKDKGLRRASQFSWEKTARETLRVITNV